MGYPAEMEGLIAGMERSTLPSNNVTCQEFAARARLARAMAAECVCGMSSGNRVSTNSNTMRTRKALTIAMVLATGAFVSMHLYSPKSRPAQTVKTFKVEESEDPFADMIEEGDGLLAQRKAEAAEADGKRRMA